MNNDRLTYLMDGHVKRQLTVEEQAELQQMLADDRYEAAIKAYIDAVGTQAPQRAMRTGASQEIEETILATEAPATRPVVRPLRRWGWAAAVAILCTGAAIYLLQRPSSPVAHAHAKPGQPGSDKAILTLANGNEVALDSAGFRNIQPGISQRGSQLQYDANVNNSETLTYNTLTVPRGGQFQLVLPDGSKAWLNADSRLKYPTAFAAGKREVELEGEGYFEIAADAARPFVMKVANRETIQVLGTAFNVMAYTNEPHTNTTLVSGKINIRSGNDEHLLLPGQQASVDNTSGALQVNAADTAMVLAWKTGFFELDHTDLASFMRQLSRWYNVDITDQSMGKYNDKILGGRISRNLRLEDVLRVLKHYDIQCRLDDHNIVLLP